MGQDHCVQGPPFSSPCPALQVLQAGACAVKGHRTSRGGPRTHPTFLSVRTASSSLHFGECAWRCGDKARRHCFLVLSKGEAGVLAGQQDTLWEVYPPREAGRARAQACLRQEPLCGAPKPTPAKALDFGSSPLQLTGKVRSLVHLLWGAVPSTVRGPGLGHISQEALLTVLRGSAHQPAGMPRGPHLAVVLVPTTQGQRSSTTQGVPSPGPSTAQMLRGAPSALLFTRTLHGPRPALLTCPQLHVCSKNTSH